MVIGVLTADRSGRNVLLKQGTVLVTTVVIVQNDSDRAI